MNKPSVPTPPFVEASPPYELDVYGWAFAQARLVREGRFAVMDATNVAEELEDLGSSIQGSAESALRVLMMHLLKWRHQPERRSRSWASTIAVQRVHFDKIMRKNPSLKATLEEMRADSYRLARLEASGETDLPLKTFPVEPLDWAVILDEPFEFDSD